MYWKVIYKDGTEIREGQLLPEYKRAKLHNGQDSGEWEGVYASSITIDRDKLAQFIIYNDEGIAVHSEQFPPSEHGHLIYRKRAENNAYDGITKFLYIVIGKYYNNGTFSLKRVYQDGHIEDHEPDIELIGIEKFPPHYRKSKEEGTDIRLKE